MMLLSIFLIVCIIIMLWIARVMMNQEEMEEKRARLLFEKNNILDCSNTSIHVPCVTDRQCQENCRSGILFTCIAGFCQVELQAVDTIEPADCDAERGQIVVLNALDSLVVDYFCISLYRDVIEDGGNLRNYVCDGGEMYINLEEGPFQVSDCKCPEEHTRLTYRPGAFHRDTPVCIRNRPAILYSRVYGTS
ncbi:ORF29 [Agrotis segetum granulovirus]|uniref:ORF29 n=1 Tax=Agrotis segetum granulosis virus TaxID=10464 RepID=Q6QXE8_GVAS|nr:pif3 [Agrotis segetum granulovirus]AAS82709.1 ORF29 [Agrotis segetum granulovirus]AHN92072.1 pif-3 [Agrotis segetum granulovirus]AKN63307.1 pif3 [Agrotis segetum granulovirus]